MMEKNGGGKSQKKFGKAGSGSGTGAKKRSKKKLLILLLLFVALGVALVYLLAVTGGQGKTEIQAPADNDGLTKKTGFRPGALASGANEHVGVRESRITSGELVSGELFAQGIIDLIEEQLGRGFGGWRPNNLLIGGIIPLDNVENFQLGVLSVVRRLTIVFKEKMARRGGGSDEFDPNIDLAMTRFHMDETKFWFPDADKMLQQGVDQLKIYKRNLHNGTAEFQPRSDNIWALLYAFRDLFGDCNQALIKTHEKDGRKVSMFDTDDYYYYCKGVGNASYRLIEVVAEEFDNEIRAKGGHQVLAEMLESLERTTHGEPLIVLDGGQDDLRANHRKNLAAWIADARNKVTTLQDIIVK